MMLAVTLIFISLVATGNCQSNISSQEFVNSINNLNTTWTAQINFINLTDNQLPVFCSRDIEEVNVSMQEVHLIAPMPSEFDARSEWSHCQTICSIYNQGRCGSCWV